GVPGTTSVFPRMLDAPAGRTAWNGTVTELRDMWCSEPLARRRRVHDAWQAPFRAALRNDKLAMILVAFGDGPPSVRLRGGRTSGDPSVLALETVWFKESSTSGPTTSCPHVDRSVTVTRYQFDRAHELVDMRDRVYCGRAPLSAFR